MRGDGLNCTWNAQPADQSSQAVLVVNMDRIGLCWAAAMVTHL